MSEASVTENKIDTKHEAFALMDQLPAQMYSGVQPRAESPLHHADLATLAKQGPQDGGVILQELKFRGHLVLRGSIDNQDFMNGAKKVLGVDLPTTLQSATVGDVTIRWVAPDEWLVVMPGANAFQMERDLRDAMGGHYSIVNVSGGQTIISLSGPHAADVLKKSTPYDVHDKNFPVGKVVTSVFAKSQAMILRSSPNAWELVIRRSFADYAWLWLQDASAEYGLVIKD